MTPVVVRVKVFKVLQKGPYCHYVAGLVGFVVWAMHCHSVLIGRYRVIKRRGISSSRHIRSPIDQDMVGVHGRSDSAR